MNKGFPCDETALLAPAERLELIVTGGAYKGTAVMLRANVYAGIYVDDTQSLLETMSVFEE